ncbi:hypothetical protein OS493_028262 [Desmophyllum pertusum]|uniref:Uncharacterized protein n=1 Tax=Desmophyllum pertusum TaxID=174260 RepID=A0A9X0CKB2_9CNID|nr:hypothetical protein OS493_028262 [Desmophyllum pertusum]
MRCLSQFKQIREINKYAVPGLLKVLATSLISPRPEYRLRELDSSHLSALKQELLSCPITCGKPMIVVAKDLGKPTDFNVVELDSYELKVIGGNHRREVILKILKDETYQSQDCFKFVYVQVYSGAPYFARLGCNTIDAHLKIDISAGHQKKKKVVLCKQILQNNFSGKKCAEWRRTCALVIGEDVSFFIILAMFDLNIEQNHRKRAVLKIVFIRTSTELNGKVWTPATQGSKSHQKKLEGKTCDGGLSKLPLQAPSRRPYRKKMEDLLTDLEEGKLTFSDMKEEASCIKEVKEVQRNWK